MLWGISSYFNPQQYASRLRNYREFRRRLDLPLAVVELGYGGSYDLGPDDADLLIQYPGRDVIWQKERLLNLALAALPPECDKVVWLDADGVFENPSWAEQTSRLLDEYPLVQPFSEVLDLGPGDPASPTVRYDPQQRAPSVASCLVAGQSMCEAVEIQFDKLACTNGKYRFLGMGNAWAGRRDLLSELGLYDGCIVGGGDMAIVCAAAGEAGIMHDRFGPNEQHRIHYLTWAEKFHSAIGGRIGCAEGLLYHLWHGEISCRRYISRHDLLRQHNFDPYVDIAPDENGCWRWNSHKPQMHEHIANYFQERREEDSFSQVVERASAAS